MPFRCWHDSTLFFALECNAVAKSRTPHACQDTLVMYNLQQIQH